MMSANPMRPADAYEPHEGGVQAQQQRPLPASPSPPPTSLQQQQQQQQHSPSAIPSAAHVAPAVAPSISVPPAAGDNVSAYPILRHGVMQSVSVGAAPRGGGGASGFTAAASPSHAQAVAAATKAAEAAAAQPSTPAPPLPALRWSRSAVQLLSCGSRRSPGGTLTDADLNGALEFASMKGATLTAVTSAAAVRLQQMPQAAAAAATAASDDADPSQGNTRLFLIGGQLPQPEAELGPDRIRVYVCNMNDAMAAAGAELGAGAEAGAAAASAAADSTTATATAATFSSSSASPSSLWQVLECTGDVPRARFGHSATFVPPASIFVYGGFASAPQLALAAAAGGGGGAGAPGIDDVLPGSHGQILHPNPFNPAPRARALATQVTFGEAYLLDCNTLVWTKVATPPQPQPQPQSQSAHPPGGLGHAFAAAKGALKSVTPGRRAFHSCVYFLNERHVDTSPRSPRTAVSSPRESPRLGPLPQPQSPSPRPHGLPHKPSNVTTPPEPVPELILFGGCRTVDRPVDGSGGGTGGGDDDEADDEGPLQYLSDLFVFNLTTMKWRLLNQCFGDHPSARAQHTAVVVSQLSRRSAPAAASSASGAPPILGLSSRMLVYSGCDRSHLLSNCYSLDLWTYTWTRVVADGEVVPRRQIKGVHAMQHLPHSDDSAGGTGGSTGPGSGGGGSREWVRRMLQTKREGFVMHLPDPPPADAPGTQSKHALSPAPPRAPTAYMLLVGDNETSRTVPPTLNSSARPVQIYLLNTATGFWSSLHVVASVTPLPLGRGGAGHPSFRNHKPCALLQAPAPAGSPENTPPRTLLCLVTRAALYTLDLSHLRVEHLSRRVTTAAPTAAAPGQALRASSARADAARMLLHSPVLRMQSSFERNSNSSRTRGGTVDSSASSSPAQMPSPAHGSASPFSSSSSASSASASAMHKPHAQRALSQPVFSQSARGQHGTHADGPDLDLSANGILAPAPLPAPVSGARLERVRTVGESALRQGAAALKSSSSASRRQAPSMRTLSTPHDEAYNRMSSASELDSGNSSSSSGTESDGESDEGSAHASGADLSSEEEREGSDTRSGGGVRRRSHRRRHRSAASKPAAAAGAVAVVASAVSSISTVGRTLRNKNNDTVAEQSDGEERHVVSKAKRPSPVAVGSDAPKQKDLSRAGRASKIPTLHTHTSHGQAHAQTQVHVVPALEALEEFPPVSSAASALSMLLSPAIYAHRLSGSSGAASPSPGHLHLEQSLSVSSVSANSAKSAGSSGAVTPTSAASARAGSRLSAAAVAAGLPRGGAAGGSKLGLGSYTSSPLHSSSVTPTLGASASSSGSGGGGMAITVDTDLFGNAIAPSSAGNMSPASAKMRAFTSVLPAAAATGAGATSASGKKLPPPALPLPPRAALADAEASSPGLGGVVAGADAPHAAPRVKSSGLRPPPPAAAAGLSNTKLRRTVSESDSGSVGLGLGLGGGFGGPDLFGNQLSSHTPEPAPIPAAIALGALPSASNKIGPGFMSSPGLGSSASGGSSSSAGVDPAPPNAGLHSPVPRQGVSHSHVSAEASRRARSPGGDNDGADAEEDERVPIPTFPVNRPPSNARYPRMPVSIVYQRSLHPNQALWSNLMKQIRDVPAEQHGQQWQRQKLQQQQAMMYKSAHSPLQQQQQYKMPMVQKSSPHSKRPPHSKAQAQAQSAAASPSPLAPSPLNGNLAGTVPPPASWAGCAGWSVADVSTFLSALGPSFERYAPAFREAAIDGRQLAVLDDEDLRELGVASRIHRKTLLSAIQAASAPQPQAQNQASTPRADHMPQSPPQAQQQHLSPPSLQDDRDGSSSPSPSSSAQPAPAPSLMPSGINIIRASSLSNIQRLGAGNFGVTYKCHWRDPSGRTVDVVVKVPRSKSGADEWNELLAFLEVPPHRHVLPLIGICTDFPALVAPDGLDELRTPPGTPVSGGGGGSGGGGKKGQTCCFVTLFMERGSLKDILSSPHLCAQLLGGDILDPSLHNRSDQDPSREGRAWARVLTSCMRILLHIAEGLAHLHSHRILHRDVASRNILVNQRGEALLSDFGLSRKINSSTAAGSSEGVTDSSGMHHDTGMELAGAAGGYYRLAQPEQTALPLRWMSAESLCEYLFTTASDTWSWGVCAWELLTRAQAVPYADLHTYNQLMAKVGGGSRVLTLPPYVPPRLSGLVSRCWEYDSAARPSMGEIVKQLREMIAQAEAVRIQVERIRREQGDASDVGAEAVLDENGYVRMHAASSPPSVRAVPLQQQQHQQQQQQQTSSPSSPAIASARASAASTALVARSPHSSSSSSSMASSPGSGAGNTVTFGSVTVASSMPARDGRSAFVESNTTHTMNAGRKGAGVLSKAVSHRHQLAQHAAPSASGSRLSSASNLKAPASEPSANGGNNNAPTSHPFYSPFHASQGYASGPPQSFMSQSGYAPGDFASPAGLGASPAAIQPVGGLLQQHVHMRAAAVHAGPQNQQQRVHYSESYDMLAAGAAPLQPHAAHSPGFASASASGSVSDPAHAAHFSPSSVPRHGVMSSEQLEQQQQQFARFQMQAHQQTTRPLPNPAASYPRAALGLPPLDDDDGGADLGSHSHSNVSSWHANSDSDPALTMLASQRAAPESTFRRKVSNMQSRASGLVGALRNSLGSFMGGAQQQQQQSADGVEAWTQHAPQQQQQQQHIPPPPVVRQTSAAQRVAELEWQRQSDQVQLATPPSAVLEEELQMEAQQTQTQTQTTVLLPLMPAPVPVPLPTTQSHAVNALLATAALILPPPNTTPAQSAVQQQQQ